MIEDANGFDGQNPDPVPPSDICIIGGGMAGIGMALALAGRGLSVCLLEAGGSHYSQASQRFYEGETWDNRYSLVSTRTRMIGGSSNCWGGWTRPPGTLDFGPRPWLSHLSWPIGEADLAPYYAAASRLMKAPAPEPDAVRNAALLPALKPAATIGGDKLDCVFFGMSAPIAYQDDYGDALEKAEGLRVVLNATVVGLVTDPASDRITSVDVRSRSGRFRVRSRIFVLAAGGIENPRLLLASGGIGNGHDLVGRYFMDHPRIQLRHLLVEDATPFVQLFDARHYGGGSALGPTGLVRAAFSPSAAEQERAEVLQSYTGLVPCYFGQSDSTLEDARQIYRALRGSLHDEITPARVARSIATLPHSLAYVVGRKLKLHGHPARFELETVLEPMPDRDNRVVLSGETDAYGVPRVHVTWRRHDIERRTHEHAVSLISRAIETRGYGRPKFAPDFWESERWDANVLSTWHHMGTTRMATSPSEGVVDTDGKVFGTSNLYATGSSVFPTGGGMPPTHLLTVMALRLADHVAECLGRASAAA